ncbi:3-deoxy-manno-octulosonate cytidylyltransferase [Polynucleobacter sp. AP-Ainpum-60-G11]|uniref:3-deoxy-manno-octulosonate cytidylyltransferase n=1 Tax=Polynucleobacter sp. AP-Ainpum-60-G11 TaxID=2576926 RepID=UPI001BFEBB1D|nr:3-deoxy-manno-octulosonate cytidylyltransferase [Polynucleobacter sp. AP-Ainpum-60-G11]QWE27017.1 3-deoxy-manno-octulosonate cytidylyltransferase [Polynucleobacter sp. AP-Ainpum-60-G11]
MSNKLKIVAIIPARMGSSRFPGKPLALLGRMPMIGVVYKNVEKSPLLSRVVVATCDQEIYEYVQSINGKAIMTSPEHERASDRCAEALIKLEVEEGKRYDIVVMVQGDEPLINEQMIEQALSPMLDNESINVTNLVGRIKTIEEFEDRNCIKVVCDVNNYALYFSREPIPTLARIKNVALGKQICVIPFRRDYLLKYTEMKPTPLEICESIDMLRVIEHGDKVYMASTEYECQSVDTPQDLEKVRRLLNL